MAASEGAPLKLHEILRFKEKFSPADIQALQEKLLTMPDKAKNIVHLISNKIKPTPALQKAALEDDPSAIAVLEEQGLLTPELWASFGKSLEQKPRSIDSVKDQSKIPDSVWGSFGKILERLPQGLLFVRDQSKLLDSVWSSFGKGLENDPTSLRLVKDQSILPDHVWVSFGKGLEKKPYSIAFVKYQSKLPDSAWVSLGKGLENNPDTEALRYVKEEFKHKIPKYKSDKTAMALRVAGKFLAAEEALPQGLKNVIQTVKNKMKRHFHFEMPSGVEWRTYDHPDYEMDKKQNTKSDDGGFITRDFKKIYINLDAFKNKSYEDFVAHEMGHFLDKELGGGSSSFSRQLNAPYEVFAMMVDYVLNDGHSGGAIQTRLYNAVCDEVGIPEKDRVPSGIKSSCC